MTTKPDETEAVRRKRLAEIGAQVESLDANPELKRLEARYGRVWDTAHHSCLRFAFPASAFGLQRVAGSKSCCAIKPRRRMVFTPSLGALFARMMNTAWATSFASWASLTWRSAAEYTKLTCRTTSFSKADSEPLTANS